MGNGSGLSTKLNKSVKQFTALLIVLSLAIPQNLFANNPSDGADGNKSELSAERVDFAKAITNEELTKIGVPSESMQMINNTSVIAGQKVDIDVIKGELPEADADKLVKVLVELEPEIRQAVELVPETKFEFINTTEASQKKMSIPAREILNILESIKETSVSEHKVPDSLASEYRELLVNMFKGTMHIFDKTTRKDVFWSFWRLAGSGGGATLGFHYGLNIPLPVSVFLGGALIGGGSASIGLFLEKFTGWLENNKVTAQNTRRYNRIGSVETYMLLSPILIGLQETGLNSLAGAGLIAGTAALSVVVQNAYLFVKKRSPRAAMWYKWYATEALFLTVPSLFMPAFQLHADNVGKAILSAFVTALMSTASQGVWDILLTDYIRKPLLKEAIRKDISNLSERISETPFTDQKFSEILLDYEKRHAEENKVRSRFKKYFYAASLVSVLSAVAKVSGNYSGMDWLESVGTAGLVALGVSGVSTWAYVWYKRSGADKIKTALRDMRLATVGLVSKKAAAEQRTYLSQRDLVQKLEKANFGICKSFFAN